MRRLAIAGACVVTVDRGWPGADRRSRTLHVATLRGGKAVDTASLCRETNMQINKSMLTAHQDRWRIVAEMEMAEQRQTSAAQRWRKMNSLVRMAAGLGILMKDDDAQAQAVHRRWNLLKELYLADLQGRTE